MTKDDHVYHRISGYPGYPYFHTDQQTKIVASMLPLWNTTYGIMAINLQDKKLIDLTPRRRVRGIISGHGRSVQIGDL